MGEVFLLQSTTAVCSGVSLHGGNCTSTVSSTALHGADHAGVSYSRQEWLKEDSEEQLGWANSLGH